MSKAITLILLFTLSLVSNWSHIKHYNQYALHFIDVGQGDAILIRTPTGCTMFIDGGPGNQILDNLYKYLPATERKIDLLVLSHPHLDHMNGLILLLNRYQVKNIFTTGVIYPSSSYQEFTRLTIDSKIHYVQTNQSYSLCGLTIQVLYPTHPLLGQELENVNNASIVLRIKIKDTWIYLSGDAEHEAEHEILNLNVDLKSDIMKAGHHGSRTSNTTEILEAVQPKEVIIQSGEGNQYQHPHFETLQNLTNRNITIKRNDKRGTISYYF